MLADKNAIAAAVQDLFNVRVEGVRTQVRKGKSVRFRQKEAKQSDWKRAVVTLNIEDKIDFF
jgi:large subunit ribosomal protein L23